jgi:hypothetical protein
MDDYVVAYHHTWINHDSRIDETMLADYGVVTDVDILEYLGIIPYPGMMAHVRMAAEIDFLAEFGSQEPGRPETAVAAVGAFLGSGVFKEVGQGLVGVIDPDQSGRNRFLGLEILIHEDDAGAAGVNVFFVFRIGIEAQLTRFAMFYLCKRGNPCLRVSVYGTL